MNNNIDIESSKTKTDFGLSPNDKLANLFEPHIEFIWRNLCYTVNISKSFFNVYKKNNEKNSIQLIKNLNGCLVSGQLTAILGPSGAGKTTLIECLSGRRRSGVSGQIIANCNGANKKIRIGYYSQKDSLMGHLTIRETLLYASKLMNCQKKSRKNRPVIDNNANEYSYSVFPDENVKIKLLNEKYYHQLIVEKMIKDLGLKQCADTRVYNCSGGQARRLSIALELIFSPSILLLDEPTSGLDSLSCLQCISMLKDLTRQENGHSMVIAASLHQPSATVLAKFDHLYIISISGQCIYDGPTALLLDHLSQFDLTCPQFHNPADFAIEVANGDYGLKAISQLVDYEKNYKKKSPPKSKASIKLSKIIQNSQKHVLIKQALTSWILIKRCFFITIRDPILYWLRFFSSLLTIAFVFVLYMNNQTGNYDGCIQRPSAEMAKSFESLDPSDLISSLRTLYPNFGFIFSTVLFIGLLSILPTLLTFPLEVSVLLKEHFNGWYSLGSYYLAKSLADIPPNLIFPILYGSAAYFVTGQLFEPWRFSMFIFVLILLSFLTQSFGFLVSAFYVNDINSATVVGTVINVPLFLFTGLLIPINSMPKFIQPITYISYFRLSFEALMVIIYGYGRCVPIEPLHVDNITSELGIDLWPVVNCLMATDLYENVTQFMVTSIDRFNKQIENSNSYALQNFEFNEQILTKDIIYMIVYTIILRILGYVVLRWRTKVK